MYLDIHTHLADEGYDIPAEWEKIKSAGVGTVVLAGDTLAHSRMHRDIAAQYEGMYFTAGVHPSEAENFSEETLAALEALLADKKCIAVGEIGLDYHWDTPERSVQQKVFSRQLELAHAHSLPVQIHSRDCFADMLAMLRERRELLTHGFLMHCYSHGAANVDAFAQLGGYFSFGGVACFKNAKNVWESVCACPAERILSETDSPYLSPVRGEKNTSANIPVIVARLAALRGEETEALAARILKNAQTLFPKLGKEADIKETGISET